MATSSRYFSVLGVMLSIAVAGCGGGGGYGSAPTPAPPTTPPTTPPTPPPAGGDTNLTTLGLSIGGLEQQFQPSLTSYTAKVGYLDNAVRIELRPADPAAVVRVNGTTVATGTSERIALSEGQNAIDIVVQNGSVQKTYSIALTRETRATFGQSAYMKASNSGIEDNFGTALALSGDTLVIGALMEDSDARGINLDGSNDASSDSGAAYVLVRDAVGVWSQQAYLKASNADSHDNFGYSVAISDNLIAIGAPFEAGNAVGLNGNQADNSLQSAGAVYIFVRDTNGQWTQEAYIKPSKRRRAASSARASRWMGTLWWSARQRCRCSLAPHMSLPEMRAARGASKPSSPRRMLVPTAASLRHWPCRAIRSLSEPRPTLALATSAAPSTSFGARAAAGARSCD